MRSWRNDWRARLNPGDLLGLATKFGTDKWGSHWYAQHYQRHFAPLRKKKITILEIGIGGYESPTDGGRSLRMWKQFFPHALVVGLDLYDKQALQQPRIRIFQGSQDDPEVFKHIVAEVGPPDIVIDDGSHQNQHVIDSFKILFPLLKDDGIYVVEDTETSYWPSLGGLLTERDSDRTAMGFFKGLIDGLNHSEYLLPEYVPSYYDRHIVAMHFYHNMVFIYKGVNDEGSKHVQDGRFFERSDSM